MEVIEHVDKVDDNDDNDDNDDDDHDADEEENNDDDDLGHQQFVMKKCLNIKIEDDEFLKLDDDIFGHLGDGQDQSRRKRWNANTIWRKTAPPRGRSGNFNEPLAGLMYSHSPNPLFKVPKDHMDEFMDVKKFNVFNTNNLWISMPAIQRVVREKALDMEIIVNPVIKTLQESRL